MSATIPFPVPAKRAAASPAARAQRFGLLLVALLATILVQGASTPGDVQRVVVSALVGATLVLALRVGEARRSIVLGGLVLAFALACATIVQAITGHVGVLSTAICDALLVMFAPPAVALGVLRSLRRHGRVRIDAVLGVLCLYLLFGMFCAFGWAILNELNPPFFANHGAANGSNFQYFSFVTLATVGYGDFTARTPLGHTLSVLEALVGQIYLVTVVSVFVTNIGRNRAVNNRAVNNG